MSNADVTVLIVSYNTRELTLTCLETLLANTRRVRLRVIVVDNDSRDGSPEAVEAAFPQVEVIRAGGNLGFAAANNLAARRARSAWLLLLNPDTEVHPGAVDALHAFAEARPEAGIYGGRTVFPDGTLNPASCWNRMTRWSLLCSALGLSYAFRRSELFNPEAMGGWARDSVREVDIVVGCFLLIRRSLWEELGGFDLRYYMFGEEADLCLRARERGWRPAITPEATIMHLVGASATRTDKTVMVAKAKTTLVRDHWPAARVGLGLGLMWLWAATRMTASRAQAALPGAGGAERRDKWAEVWRRRGEWLRGYEGGCGAAEPSAGERGGANPSRMS